MERDPTRVCELLVGLPAVNVFGVDDEPDAPILVHIESRWVRPDAEVQPATTATATRPPSTSTTVPCTKRDSSLAK